MTGGLFSLQHLCRLLAFACAVDRGLVRGVQAELRAKGYSLGDVLEVLREAALRIPPPPSPLVEEGESESGADRREQEESARERRVILTLTAALKNICPPADE